MFSQRQWGQSKEQIEQKFEDKLDIYNEQIQKDIKKETNQC